MDRQKGKNVGTDVFTVHGGNLAAARARFKSAPEPWLDLSTGINPVPYPIPPIPTQAWTRLPEPGDVAALERAAAKAYRVTGMDVVAAPGTQSLIQILPQIFKAKTVGIHGHTYAEHEAVWSAAGASVYTIEEDETVPADVVVVVNPNNPDGRCYSIRRLVEIVNMQDEYGGVLVIDEAFADLEDPEDSACANDYLGAVVLRSFGKTYGLAGLRLGFAVAPAPIAAAIRAALGPWSVSGPAIAVGQAALADRAWLADTRRRLEADGERLMSILSRAGMVHVGGTLLFQLVSVADARAAFEQLAERGILVRRFEDRPGVLRFGIPAPGEPFDILEQRLAGLDFRGR